MKNLEQRKQIHFESIGNLELREKTEGEKKSTQITGYASVFNQITDLGYFKERVAPGAFKRSLKERPDVRALWDHDSGSPIGRTTAGSLTLKEDTTGLYIELTPPDTQAGRDTIELVRTGHVTGMSFGFMPVDASWDLVDKEEVRTLTDVDLFEISIVTFPAYEGTSAEARSLHLSKRLAEQYVEPVLIFEARSADLKLLADQKAKQENQNLKNRIAWLEKTM